MKLVLNNNNKLGLYDTLLELSKMSFFELLHISDLSDKFISIKELHLLYSPEQYNFEALGVTVKITDKISNEIIGCVLLIHTTKIVLLPYNAKIVLLNKNEPRSLDVVVSKQFRPSLWGRFSYDLGGFTGDKIIMSSTQIETYKNQSKHWDENHNVKIINAIKDKVIFVDGWDYNQVYSYHLDTFIGDLKK